MKLWKNIRNGALAMSATAATAVATMPNAFAAMDGTSKQIIQKIIDLIQTMALFIGIVLLAWSVLMLMLAFKNEDADSKSRAIMLIVVSIMLIGFGSFVKTIINAAAPGLLP